VGPAYRNHALAADGLQAGHLETAHLCWAVAGALDLAPDAFTESERDEVAAVLRDRGARMCLRWLDQDHAIANWWCVMTSGLAVTAAVLGEEDLLARARVELKQCCEVFQPDGSYAESLQYGNYAILALTLASEALRRRGEDVESFVPLGRYAGYVRWATAAHLYMRPMSGWGEAPRARAINFGDSGAVFRPTADVLLHIAARGRQSHPMEAGLARWLFERTYPGDLASGPHDLSSFSLRTNWGFLTLPLLIAAADPIPPQAAGWPSLAAFDSGDTIARDGWQGRTVVAMRGGADDLLAPGHLHRDLNSLIVVHNQQRLLVDAGHSCYRNLQRRLELSTELHNTCAFLARGADGSWKSLEQRDIPQRWRRRGRNDPSANMGTRERIACEVDDVRVMGGEVSAAYGAPIHRFARWTALCGSHVLFVVDHIVTDEPVRTRWSWLLNNRDGQLDLKLPAPDRLVARRGNAGMKLFSLTGGEFKRFEAHMNDAYHCLPGQPGEGRPGSAVLVQWTESEAAAMRRGVHAMALDSYGAIAGWHLKTGDGFVGLEAPGATACWTIRWLADELVIGESVSSRAYRLGADSKRHWALERTAGF
jgi:hypothetical protein